MADNIVGQLRTAAIMQRHEEVYCPDLLRDAAVEIERLRAERDRWRKIADDFAEAGSNFVSHSEVADDYEEARRD